jgi:SpoVK/Ycf46/Vps4 family AAA+-type ATPase
MAHSIIVGITGTGKTTLAFKIAERYRARKIPVLVYDPFKRLEWQADFITDKPEEIVEVVFKNKSCAVFIDEAGEFLDRYSKEDTKLATMSRQLGHNVHFIAQRAQMLSPNVRHQCTNLFMFRQVASDCDLLSKDFANEQLKAGSGLEKGECFVLDGSTWKITKINIFKEKS